MRDFRDGFQAQVNTMQERISNAVVSYLDVAGENFDLVQSDNALRESEQDPEFRDRVSEAARSSRGQLRGAQAAVDV